MKTKQWQLFSLKHVVEHNSDNADCNDNQGSWKEIYT